MDVVNGFAQKGSHRNNLQLGAALKLVAKGNGVCDKYLRKSLCAVDAVNGGARQHTVGGAGHNFAGAVFQQHFSTCAQRTSSVDHVVHHNGKAAFHIANNVHGLCLIGLVAALVHDGQGGIEALGIGTRSFNAARIGRNNNNVVFWQPPQGFKHDRYGKQVVHRAVKIALDLPRVQVNGNHALGTGNADKVCHHFGADGRTGADFAILTRIAIIRNNGCYSVSAGPLEGIKHEAKLHQVAVDVRRAGGLHHKNVITANIVAYFYPQLAVAERGGQRRRELTPQMVADGLGQIRIG